MKPMALKAVSSIAKVVTVDHDGQNDDGQLDCCFDDSDDDDDNVGTKLKRFSFKRFRHHDLCLPE